MSLTNLLKISALGYVTMRLPDDLVLKSVALSDQYFDLRGLSVYSALSVSTLRNHIRGDGLPAYALRGKLLIRRSEFDKWVLKYRLNRTQDLNALTNDVMQEIGCVGRRSNRPNG